MVKNWSIKKIALLVIIPEVSCTVQLGRKEIDLISCEVAKVTLGKSKVTEHEIIVASTKIASLADCVRCIVASHLIVSHIEQEVSARKLIATEVELEFSVIERARLESLFHAEKSQLVEIKAELAGSGSKLATVLESLQKAVTERDTASSKLQSSEHEKDLLRAEVAKLAYKLKDQSRLLSSISDAGDRATRAEAKIAVLENMVDQLYTKLKQATLELGVSTGRAEAAEERAARLEAIAIRKATQDRETELAGIPAYDLHDLSPRLFDDSGAATESSDTAVHERMARLGAATESSEPPVGAAQTNSKEQKAGLASGACAASETESVGSSFYTLDNFLNQ